MKFVPRCKVLFIFMTVAVLKYRDLPVGHNKGGQGVTFGNAGMLYWCI